MLTRREWLRLAGAGAGLGVLSSRDVEAVLEAGMDEATLRMILYDNPRRFLAFVPVRG